MATIQLPAEAVQPRYATKNAFLHLEHTPDRARSAGADLDSEASTRSSSASPRYPSFLLGIESPQSMRVGRPEALLRLGQGPAPGFVPVLHPVPLLFVPLAPAPASSSGPPSPASKPEKPRRKKAPAARKGEATVLLRNLPRDLGPPAVLERLAAHREELDFLYVPTDFETGASLGYAFLNFGTPAAVQALERALPALFPGGQLQPARVQGQAANVKRFRNSSVMAQLPDDRKPMLFKAGVPQGFPAPTKKLPPVGPKFRPAGQ